MRHQADLELALQLCDAADEITLSRFRAADLVVETKPDMTPVSEADKAVERAIRERLSAVRPDDAVIGEEYGAGEGAGSGAAENGRRWIIDPIDGTKNYVRGVPVYATLLALEQHGRIEVGVVSAPAMPRRWWAARGVGAWCRDPADAAAPEQPRRLAVSKVAQLTDASVSFGGFEEWAEVGRVDAMVELAGRCWRSRGYGDFWSHMMVAEGIAEIGLDPIVSLWDLAPLQVIVEEAGGRFTDFTGAARADGGDGIATNGLVHDAALQIIGR